MSSDSFERESFETDRRPIIEKIDQERNDAALKRSRANSGDDMAVSKAFISHDSHLEESFRRNLLSDGVNEYTVEGHLPSNIREEGIIISGDDEPYNDAMVVSPPHYGNAYHVYSDEPILLNRDDLEGDEDSLLGPDADQDRIEIIDETVYPSPQSGLVDIPPEYQNMPPVPHEVLAEGGYDWYINDWQSLKDLSKVFSPTFTIGEYSWRVLMFPKGNTGTGTVSLFLDSINVKDPNEKKTICCQFTIGIFNLKNMNLNLIKYSTHRFTSAEADWGFARFISENELEGRALRDEKPGFVDNNRFLVRVHLKVVKDKLGTLWMNMDQYDSRHEVGLVGIKNQGATCYMNSLLQSLFSLSAFKKSLYKIPWNDQDLERNIPLALQKFFYHLHTSPGPVSTKELTQSFGWDSMDAFIQQDIQELKALLFDSLEAKLKGTPGEKDLDKLFMIKSMRYIKCLNVDYSSQSISTFYDIPLEIQGVPDLKSSFEKYIEKETFEGANQYKAEGHGYQDAVTGNVFIEFPPVLYLNLKRYEYDYNQDRICKVNDYYEFPESIDLSPYYEEKVEDNDKSMNNASTGMNNASTGMNNASNVHESCDEDGFQSRTKAKDQKYQLFGILVHAGDFGGGHYYAFLKDFEKDRWIRFDDDRVYYVEKEEAVDDNYGDGTRLTPSDPAWERYQKRASSKPALSGLAARIKMLTSAYMLIYIREKDLPTVLASFRVEKDIPTSLMTLCETEKAATEAKRLEKVRAYNQQRIYIVSNEYFSENHGPYLMEDFFASPYEKKQRQIVQQSQGLPVAQYDLPMVELQKSDTLSDLKVIVFKEHGILAEHQRYWLVTRSSTTGIHTVSKALIGEVLELKTPFRSLTGSASELVLYLEIFIPSRPLYPITNDSTLLFVKLFKPESRNLSFVSSIILHGNLPLFSQENLSRWQTFLTCNELLQPPSNDTDVIDLFKVYEETKGDSLTLFNTNALVKLSLKETSLTTGDILVLESKGNQSLETAADYYQWLSKKVIVTFKLNASSEYNESLNTILATQLKCATKLPSEDLLLQEQAPFEEEQGTFHIELSLDDTYETVSKALYEVLVNKFGLDAIQGPQYLAFRIHDPIMNVPRSSRLPFLPDLPLSDMLPKTHYLSRSNLIHYEVLDLSLPLFQLKKPLRIQYMTKVDSLLASKVLLLDENDSFGHVLEKLSLKLSPKTLKDEIRSPTVGGPSGQYRLLHVQSSSLRILQSFSDPSSIPIWPNSTTTTYEKDIFHLEEIPADQSSTSGSDDNLIQVVSFHKDFKHPHGFPFYFSPRLDEPLTMMKARLRATMTDSLLPCLSTFTEKEWEKVHLCILSTLRPIQYLQDPTIIPATLINSKIDLLGLDFPSKTPTVPSPLEKSLKLGK